MYADNYLIYTIGNEWEYMVPKIQTGLDSFQQWCLHNSMTLNVKKSKAFVIASTFKKVNLDLDNRFVLNNSLLERVNSYNYLGIILDTHMTLNPLFKKVKTNCLRQDFLTCKISEKK